MVAWNWSGPSLTLQRPLLSGLLCHSLRPHALLIHGVPIIASLELAPVSCPPNLAVPNNTAVDIDAYSALLDACSRSRSLREGKATHCRILRDESCLRDASLLEKLTTLYASCGHTRLARYMFDEISQPNVFLWNSMIRAYSIHGPMHRAIELYDHMVGVGVRPNKFTFPFVLKACAGLKSLEAGTEIHRHAQRAGLESDVYVSTALIDMYMKCGHLDVACDVFRKMPCRDTVAWNAMVAGCSLHGQYEDVVGFVTEMQRIGVTPNSSTIVALLPVIGQARTLIRCKSVHGFCVRRGLEKGDVLVGTALLDAYGKCECIGYAEKIFDAMIAKNEVTWSSIIGTYVCCDRMEDALWKFNQMVYEGMWMLTSTTLASVLRAGASLTDLTRGKSIHSFLIKTGFASDLTVGNTLISMYAKCGRIDEAGEFFNEMQLKDTVSYSAIISGCVQNGNAREALLIFKEMQLSYMEPDIATMASIVPACSHLAALQHGKCTHSFITVLGFSSDTSLCNALIDMYAKCGRIDYARDVFDRMKKQDVVSWNSLIVGHGIHGLGRESLLLLLALQTSNLKPDDVTFICLLTACSHSGLVSEGKRLFQAMIEIFNISPRMEYFVCMVDLLGRAGLLSEAQDFIQGMPCEPDDHVWGALLGACRVHKNIDLAEDVSRKIQMLGNEGTGNFVLLSNIYSAAGRFDEAAKVRITQRSKGLKKIPGCSWIEVRGKVHAFVGGDQSHPDSRKIYQVLGDMLVDIKMLGYHSDTSFALQNVEEEEKEHALLYHSEKLAIEFGIISLGASQPIFVTKNLRICGDCHIATKFITMVTKRAISIRDASRFHHFKDGACNCGDFW